MTRDERRAWFAEKNERRHAEKQRLAKRYAGVRAARRARLVPGAFGQAPEPVKQECR